MPAPSKQQICHKCGWRSTSGHIKNVLGALRSAGLVDGTTLTPAGEGRAEPPAPETLAQYHDSIRRSLSGPQTQVFDPLLKGGEHDKASVCEALGWSGASGHIKNVMGALRSFGIVEKKKYRLSAMVFPGVLS